MPKLEIHYSNVITSVERHEYLQKNFAECAFKPHWRLNRFIAFDVNNPAVQAMPGELGPGGKGCYLSVLEILKRSVDDDCHTMVMDDDIEFCPRTQEVVDKILDGLPDDGWDLLLTDTIIPNAIDMPRFLYERRVYEKTGEFRLLGLPPTPYRTMAGSTIFNKHSRRKVIDMMTTTDISQPWDIKLRGFVDNKLLRAFLIFPFVTAPSHLADQSTLKAVDEENYLSGFRISSLQHRLHNDFMRMMWIGRQDETYFANHPLQDFGDWSSLKRPDVERLISIMEPLMGVMMGYPI